MAKMDRKDGCTRLKISNQKRIERLPIWKKKNGMRMDEMNQACRRAGMDLKQAKRTMDMPKDSKWLNKKWTIQKWTNSNDEYGKCPKDLKMDRGWLWKEWRNGYVSEY